ncbi:hypothetical protein AB3M83_01245 [Microbacterium sp. 179-B 1A2 NHS]|uniref:hypothetical protein n=1 Tax=Microbacterium sp. 179-B 1A2 NHS TaxID=3142383 RepID=UPI0039A04A80
MTPAVLALESALARLTRADGEAMRLLHAGRLLAAATDWQSRAADAYRFAVDEWIADLSAFTAELDTALREVRSERARLIDLVPAG